MVYEILEDMIYRKEVLGRKGDTHCVITEKHDELPIPENNDDEFWLEKMDLC